MVTITLPENVYQHLFGINNDNLRYLERTAKVSIQDRGNVVNIEGPEEATRQIRHLLLGLAELLETGYSLKNGDVKIALKAVQKEPELDLIHFFKHCRLQISDSRYVSPRSINQKAYISAMLESDAVFGIGPAGTGKTYLAAAAAVHYFQREEVKRIVLCRPALEAGERLGFLPGDIAAKVDPFLRPLYDALYDLMNFETVGKLIEKGIIEIAPLAFMRGRNLKDSFIILDEAQNTTVPQMKMFLTRMGNRSKVVINGDITQIDLPKDIASGLVHAMKVLDSVKGLSFVYLDKSDVVRHPLVERIIHAYDLAEKKKK